MSGLLAQIMDDFHANADRAQECLRTLDALPAVDLARPDIRAAAQAFGLLAVADALTSSGRGRSLADVVAIAGDVAL